LTSAAVKIKSKHPSPRPCPMAAGIREPNDMEHGKETMMVDDLAK
jgi:hypothetical protein